MKERERERENQYVGDYFKINLAFLTFTSILSNDNGRFFNVY